jgi:hypothetical protein
MVPSVLDHFAHENDRVIETRHRHQDVGVGRLGLGHLDRKILGGGIIGDRFTILNGRFMVGKMRSIAALLACPKVSLMCISTAVLGVLPVAAKIR